MPRPMSWRRPRTVGYAVNKSVIRLQRAQVNEELPPLLAETLPLLPDFRASGVLPWCVRELPACRRPQIRNSY